MFAPTPHVGVAYAFDNKALELLKRTPPGSCLSLLGSGLFSVLLLGVAERTPPVFAPTPHVGVAYASGSCLSVLLTWELFKRTPARVIGFGRPVPFTRAPSLRPGLRANCCRTRAVFSR